MKRMFMILSVCFIVACSNGENGEPEQNTDQNNDGKVSEVTGSDVAVKFAGIDITIMRKAIHITGDVQTKEDHFYYTLEHDEEIIVEETMVKVEHPGEEWSTFTVEINLEGTDLTNQDVPFLTFYGKDGGKMINPNYVPVDLVIY